MGPAPWAAATQRPIPRFSGEPRGSQIYNLASLREPVSRLRRQPVWAPYWRFSGRTWAFLESHPYGVQCAERRPNRSSRRENLAKALAVATGGDGFQLALASASQGAYTCGSAGKPRASSWVGPSMGPKVRYGRPVGPSGCERRLKGPSRDVPRIARDAPWRTAARRAELRLCLAAPLRGADGWTKVRCRKFGPGDGSRRSVACQPKPLRGFRGQPIVLR